VQHSPPNAYWIQNSTAGQVTTDLVIEVQTPKTGTGLVRGTLLQLSPIVSRELTNPGLRVSL